MLANPASLLAFALGAAIGGSAGGSTHNVWFGVVAGLIPLWVTAIAFALSADRTARLLRDDGE